MKLVSIFPIFLIFSLVQSQLRKPVYNNIPLKANEDVGEPLILTPYLERNQIEQAKNLSQVHYNGFQDVVSYSGYFTVNKEFNSNLFFWFFPSENDYEHDPVVLWLQGGPGSSSLFGLFSEHGPFIVNENNKIILRENTWTKNHSVIYIDNPVGTGFSFTNEGGWARNQTQVGEELYQALQQFFTLFPELQKLAFYVAGESYGGKYVPAIGHAIQIHNPTSEILINLKGLMIGNGLTDPYNQMDYGAYVYQLGLIDINTKEQLIDLENQAKADIKKGNYLKATEIMNSLMIQVIQNNSGMVSIHNYLKDYEDLGFWDAFVQTAEVRKAIHVGNTTFRGLEVWENLYEDITKSVALWVSELLEEYHVLIFNGQLDIVVPYPLTVNYLQNLNFSASDEYKNAEREIWKVGEEVAGYCKTAGNLKECLVRNAGHLVPADQPKYAFDLVYSFTRQSFSTNGSTSFAKNNFVMLVLSFAFIFFCNCNLK